MQYEYAGSWAQFDVIRERIPSKNASGVVEDYDLDVLVSRHGPIVERGADGLEALRWTGSEPTDDVSSFFKAMRADSMDAFYEAFRDYSCPPENFCVAEAGRNGRVGQILVGKIPIRKGYSGASPVDGSDPAYDWVGYIPYDSLPQRLDPPEGFVAHANNLPRGALDPNRLPVGFSFSANYRVERIIERLVHDKPLTAEKMRQIQMDDVDTTGRVFVPAILGAWDRVGTDYPGLADQVERLRGWDYRLNETSVAATLYQVWIIEFGKLCVMNHLSASAGSYIGYPDRWLPILQDYLAGTSILPWLASDDQGARDRAVLDALASTVVRLQTEVGPDPESWAWGQVHYAIFPHPSGMATLIGAGSYPWGGGRHTIRVGHYDFASMLPFQNDFGSVFRAVIASIDGKWTITAVLPPGEAGSVLSPHFKDEMDLWLTGEQRPVPFPTGTFEPTYSVSLEPAE
jgi:penicillin amidase